MHEITFTMDVEDPRPDSSMQMRYPDITREVLNFLDELNIKGTFFCVGNIASECPELIKDISSRGHEVALHSLNHTPLEYQEQETFRDETLYAKSMLEDIIQKPIIGYRAPIFSLTRKSRWAAEILKELGFVYSSSVLPASNPLFGYPGAPTKPFQWPSGLIEIPAPIGSLVGIKMPYLGGIYLRYLPSFIIKSQIKKTPNELGLWCYCHPYDFDYKQSFYKMKNTSMLISVLLWFNRRDAYKKIRKVLSGTNDISAALPFNQQIEKNQYSGLPVFY